MIVDFAHSHFILIFTIHVKYNSHDLLITLS